MFYLYGDKNSVRRIFYWQPKKRRQLKKNDIASQIDYSIIENSNE